MMVREVNYPCFIDENLGLECGIEIHALHLVMCTTPSCPIGVWSALPLLRSGYGSVFLVCKYRSLFFFTKKISSEILLPKDNYYLLCFLFIWPLFFPSRRKGWQSAQTLTYPCVFFQRNWRKPRGIDNRVRRRFKGQILMPNIGYGSNKKTKHMLPSGFRKFLVHNVKELEVLLMCNK